MRINYDEMAEMEIERILFFFIIPVQYDPDRPVVGDVIPDPVDEHIQPVAKAHQGDQMENQPGNPCWETRDLNPVI